MATYRVGLSRIFVIDVDARNEFEARRGVEFFLGFHDSSNESDWDEFGFKIREIDMVENDAFEAELLENIEKFWSRLIPS